jgi:uncharacterized protein
VLDSSAVVKVYLTEPGSSRVRSMVSAARGPAPTASVVASGLAHPETVSAIARRERNARLSAADATALIGRVDGDFTGPVPLYTVLDVTSDVLARAAALVRPHALSGADAVHLATALALRGSLPSGDSLELVTTDRRLETAAKAEGLTVIVPS